MLAATVVFWGSGATMSVVSNESYNSFESLCVKGVCDFCYALGRTRGDGFVNRAD